MSTALLLIAHGSRNAEANDDLHQLVAMLRRRGLYAVVEASFLELAKPDILEGGRACVERGAARVILVPYFLSPGIHVRQDLKEYREKLSASFPQVDFVLAEPLGPHESLAELVLMRAQQADAPLRP